MFNFNGIAVGAIFKYIGRGWLDGRVCVNTMADLLNVEEHEVPDGFEIKVLDPSPHTDFWWEIRYSNSDDPQTGKWRPAPGGSGSGGDGDGKILINVSDTNRGYLGDKIDVNTLEVQNDDILVVKSIKGLIATVEELNNLQGLDKNIMDYLTLVEKAMVFRGFINDDAALDAIAQADPKPIEGDTYIVKSSESHGDQPTYFTWAEKPGTNPKEYEFVDWPVPGGGASETMDQEGGTLIAVGGIPVGTVVKGLSSIDLWKRALFPYQKPEISISINPNKTMYEKDVERIASITITANAKRKSADLKSIKFYVGNQLMDTQNITGSDATVNKSYTYNSAITDTTTFKVEVEDSEGSVVPASTTVTFTHKHYYGFVPDGSAIDETTVPTLQRNGLQTSKGLTHDHITMTNSQYVYAYPADRGDLTSIKDKNNFEYLANYTKKAVQINGIAYNVYYLTKAISIDDAKMIYS